jgi:hypothetical protein
MADGIAVFLLLFFFLSIIWYLISEVVDAVRFGKWDRILKLLFFVFVIWLLLKCGGTPKKTDVQNIEYQKDMP